MNAGLFHRSAVAIYSQSSNLKFYLNLFRQVSTTPKMSSWQDEKEKFLSMPLDDKRTLYKTKSYKTLDEIPTWTLYSEKFKSLPDKQLSGNKIDDSQNAELAKKISIFSGDITSLEIDAIVNAANTSLLGGGGVDGAIHSAAGPLLKEECRTLKGCQTGNAKITGGYKLPAKYVIHTAGPQGEKPELLTQCYYNSLQIMKSHNLRTIAFPCVSTGIYGYPLEPAAHIAAMEVRKHLEANVDSVERVIFCLFSKEDEDIYQKTLQYYFPLK